MADRDDVLWVVLDEQGNPRHVTITKEMANDHVLECIGQHIDAGLWRVTKVRIEPASWQPNTAKENSHER